MSNNRKKSCAFKTIFSLSNPEVRVPVKFVHYTVLHCFQQLQRDLQRCLNKPRFHIVPANVTLMRQWQHAEYKERSDHNECLQFCNHLEDLPVWRMRYIINLRIRFISVKHVKEIMILCTLPLQDRLRKEVLRGEVGTTSFSKPQHNRW